MKKRKPPLWGRAIKKAFLFFSLAVFTSFIYANNPQELSVKLSPEERQWLINNPVLKVGNEQDWPPFDYAVDGVPLGYSIDLISLLAEKLNIELEFVTGLAWDELMQGLESGELDILPAINVTDERKKSFDFTPSYFANPTVIVVNVAEESIQSFDQLQGKKIAGVKGFSINEALRQELPGVQIAEYDGVVDCLKAVSLGQVDAYIDSIGLVVFTLENNFIPNLKMIGELNKGKLASPALHIAVQKNQNTLRSILTKALESISSEEKNRLKKKWLQFNRYEKQLVFTDEQIKWINKHPVVEIGVDKDYAPYSFVNDAGEYVGVVPDFIKAVEDRIGIKLVIKEDLSWEEIVEHGKSKQVDMITPMVSTEERRAYFNFSSVYIPSPLAVFTHIDNQDIASPEDLRGKRVALVKGYSSSELVVSENPHIKKLWTDTALEAIHAVAAGEADAFIAVIGVATHAIREQGLSNLKLAGYYKKDYQGQRFAIRSDWPELAVLVAQALDDISIEERKKIYDKWISVPQSDRFDWAFFFQMLAVFLLIIILLAVYNRKLSKEILRRQEMERELHQSNKSLELARQSAESANMAKTEFISSMSHELRTPLMAIIGFADLLKLDKQLKEEQLHKLGHIGKAGEHLLKLIDDLMDLSMLETGSLSLNIETVDIHSLLTECKEIISPLLSEKSLQYEDNIEAFKGVEVRVDSLRFNQVVLNTLSNAIKYNRTAGQIKLLLAKEGEYLKVAIYDTGVGMQAEQLEQLFETYNRVGAEKSEIPGRGIGMAVAKKLILAMHGDIEVSSEPEEGSCFSIFIPLA